MKNKGFTLIELLAVILILGIIALIAIPTVTSVVEQSRKGAFENSSKNILNSVDEYIISSELNGENLNGLYRISELNLDIKSNNDIDGWVRIENGKVVNYSLSNETYSFTNANEKVTLIKDRENSEFVFPYTNEAGSMKSIVDFSKKSLILNAYFLYDIEFVNYVEKWNLSNDGKIVGYLINSSTSGMYDLYVTSENNIVLPRFSANFLRDYANLEVVYFENIDSSNVEQMSASFYLDNKLMSINAEKLDVSSLINGGSFFSHCESLTVLDISTWNTKNLAVVDAMFAGMISLKELDVTNFNISKVTSLYGMFYYNNANLIGINSWDVSNINNFGRLFFVNNTRTELDISNWNTKSATNMSEMFGSCPKLNTIYVGDNWNTSGVITSNNMFNGDVSLKGYNTSKLDVSMANTNTGYLTKK